AFFPFACPGGSDMVPISDQTMAAIEYAMNALTLRAEVIANNVANSEVPDFQASKVSFEDQLRRALDGTGIERVLGPDIQGTGDPVDAIGNNVNIESEIVDMMETNLLQQAMVEAFNFKAGLLRSAIGGA
ncbi:MAG: flagellar basal body protein, partial [Acidimicrobiia bacterium]|nr:flagellar basal body protein [Acidimicrobiia bacterium]